MGKLEKTPDKITIHCDCTKYRHELAMDDSEQGFTYNSFLEKPTTKEGEPEKPTETKTVKKSWLFRNIDGSDD